MSRQNLITDRVENALLVINELSKIVVSNMGRSGSDPEPQLSESDNDAILRAVTMLSAMAHNDYCELLNEFMPSTGGVQ